MQYFLLYNPLAGCHYDFPVGSYLIIWVAPLPVANEGLWMFLYKKCENPGESWWWLLLGRACPSQEIQMSVCQFWEKLFKQNLRHEGQKPRHPQWTKSSPQVPTTPKDFGFWDTYVTWQQVLFHWKVWFKVWFGPINYWGTQHSPPQKKLHLQK